MMSKNTTALYKSGAASPPSPVATPICHNVTKKVTECRQASNCGGGTLGGNCGGVDIYGVQKRFCTRTVTTFVCSTPAPTIQVLTPNGGQTLVVGQHYQITWKGSGVKNYLIYLINSLGQGSLINGVPAPKTSYDWVVDSAIMVGTNLHKIKIIDADQSDQTAAHDESDSYFKIVTPKTPSP